MADPGLLASVVVAVKSDRRVYRLLESLLEQTAPPDSYEIVVVENGSAVLADVAAMGDGAVRYLHTPQANMAAARNLGLAAAKGQYLLLTDADCVAAPDWVEQLTDGLASGPFGAVGGAIGKYQPTSVTQRCGITVVDGQQHLSYLPALWLPYVAGANAAFITAALREVGGFDEAFKSGNDVDICYRLGLQGYAIGLAPRAVVLHEDRPTVGAHFRRFKDYAVYQVLLYAKYKHISGRPYVVNPYPFMRVSGALAAAPRALIRLLRGDSFPAAKLVLQLVEAGGVWWGDVLGSLRFRQLYV
jgi:GT2 family glycosyltransferase